MLLSSIIKNKDAERMETNDHVEAFLAKGGKVKQLPAEQAEYTRLKCRAKDTLAIDED